VKIARQELPGKQKMKDRRSRVFTRQFLPGYFQPRLSGAPPRHVRICATHCSREMPSAFLFKDI
jgi:hypothetical protein